MAFYLGALLYLAVLVMSVYGLTVSELKLGFGEQTFLLKGWLKNTLCWLGLLIVALIPAIPLLSSLGKALSNAGK